MGDVTARVLSKSKKRPAIAILTLSSFLITASIEHSRADAPPPPPADWNVTSENKQCVAHGDLSANQITVFRITEKGQQPLWSTSPWQNWPGLQLANDGQGFIIWGWPFQGGSLDQPILTFYYQGAMIRQWHLRDFFNDTSSLVKTTSHFIWSKSGASLTDHTLVVTTVDGRELSFDTSTGELRR